MEIAITMCLFCLHIFHANRQANCFYFDRKLLHALWINTSSQTRFYFIFLNYYMLLGKRLTYITYIHIRYAPRLKSETSIPKWIFLRAILWTGITYKMGGIKRIDSFYFLFLFSRVRNLSKHQIMIRHSIGNRVFCRQNRLDKLSIKNAVFCY